MRHNVTCQGLFEGYSVTGSAAYQRTKGKLYAETFRCPGGALSLDFCNSGQGARGASRTEWIAGFPDLIDWLEAAMQPLVESAVSLLTSAKLERLGPGGRGTFTLPVFGETTEPRPRWGGK